MIAQASLPNMNRHDLRFLFQAVHIVENLVLQWQLDGFLVWKDPLHFPIEMIPLLRSPELVDHEESAGQQVATQGFGFRIGEDHRTRRDEKGEGVFEQLGIRQLYRDGIRIHLHRGQFLQSVGDIPIRFRIVSIPSASIVRRVLNPSESENVLLVTLRILPHGEGTAIRNTSTPTEALSLNALHCNAN